MAKDITIKINYPQIGICGLSCILCPMHQSDGVSKCSGCKTESRIKVGCPFITCALKKKGIEFCLECEEQDSCEKWKAHRQSGKTTDSFKCYQKLEDDIDFMKRYGFDVFENEQRTREKLLIKMIEEFNEGRSKSYYCIAATIFEIDELKCALDKARKDSNGLKLKEKSKLFHSLLNDIAEKKGYYLKLRK